ncbi:hypothetical protein NXS19_002054 [Fusarium pseudograminearum]|nr:hypothetical protein NXS19_002054 [Fusarium pseudograminearum]
MGTSTTTTTMTSLAPREAASVPSSFNHSTLTTLRGALDHREMNGSRGKTSTSLDLERQSADSYHPPITTYTAALPDRQAQFETCSPTKTPAPTRTEDARNIQARPVPWGSCRHTGRAMAMKRPKKYGQLVLPKATRRMDW